MAKETKAQKRKVERVMHEFKHGELETHGRKVTDAKQAIAIALSEAGVPRKHPGTPGGAETRAALYAEARRRGIPGRSKMDKAALKRALHRQV